MALLLLLPARTSPWRSGTRGVGGRGSEVPGREVGVVGVLETLRDAKDARGLPRATLLRAAPLGGGRPVRKRANVTDSGRTGAAAWRAPGRRAGELLQTRGLKRAPRCGLSPWLPRAGGRFAPPLRAAVTAGRAPSPPLPRPRPPPGVATCGQPSGDASPPPEARPSCLYSGHPPPAPAP